MTIPQELSNEELTKRTMNYMQLFAYYCFLDGEDWAKTNHNRNEIKKNIMICKTEMESRGLNTNFSIIKE